MARMSILAVWLSLCASLALAGINLINSASSGDAGSAVVQTVTLADGEVLAAPPAR
jgi:hypothetical protein